MTTARVALAISSYRNDDAIERLLRRATAPEAQGLFAEILVVDSLGTGRIASLIARGGWRDVHYENHEANLGSAGNLARRLLWSAQRGNEYTFTLNHDGAIDPSAIRRLIALASSTPRVGAVYPLRRMTQQGRFQVPLRTIPLFATTTDTRPTRERISVGWSSSNASLYSSEPVRAGIVPWAELWMGWEDLEYGLALEEAGYCQLLAGDIEYDDDYEYMSHTIAGRRISFTSKPPWYAYYQARNLLLIAKRRRLTRAQKLRAGLRIVQQLLLNSVQDRRLERLRLARKGLADGWMGAGGRGPVP